MYETKISTMRWILYDVPGNIGWILFLIGYFRSVAGGGFSKHLFTSIMLTIPVILIIAGITELISERIAKLDRILPAIRLYRGFGALTAGGIIGAVVSLISFRNDLDTVNAVMMTAGGSLCFTFAGLLMLGFKRKD